MSHPPKQVLEVWKGNTFRRDFRLSSKVGNVTTPIDLTGSTIVLTVTWGAAIGLAKSFTSFPDGEDGKFSIDLTVEDTRLLPLGQIARYEIERQIGSEQKTLLCGTFNVGGWNNVD